MMENNTLSSLLIYVWIICWYLSFWIFTYSIQLFLTGLFSIVLALLIYEKEKEKESEKK